MNKNTLILLVVVIAAVIAFFYFGGIGVLNSIGGIEKDVDALQAPDLDAAFSDLDKDLEKLQ